MTVQPQSTHTTSAARILACLMSACPMSAAAQRGNPSSRKATYERQPAQQGATCDWLGTVARMRAMALVDFLLFLRIGIRIYLHTWCICMRWRLFQPRSPLRFMLKLSYRKGLHFLVPFLPAALIRAPTLCLHCMLQHSSTSYGHLFRNLYQ
jgi:hypothetical protein